MNKVDAGLDMLVEPGEMRCSWPRTVNHLHLATAYARTFG